ATALFYINGYSMAEVGDFLDVRVSTVKSRLHSARKRLKGRMVGMVGESLQAGAPDERFSHSVLEQIASVLRTKPEFADVHRWTGEDLTPGKDESRAFKISYRGRAIVVKRTTWNERNTLKLLTSLGLRIAPSILYPDLLDQGISVEEFVPGGQIKAKKLDGSLIEDYAEMQNVLNDRELFEKHKPDDPRCQFSDSGEGGIYAEQILGACEEGYADLVKLRHWGLPILDQYIELADRMRSQRHQLAREYSTMPYAWLQHNFYEHNIVGSPQRLVDWCHSYGHGPFLCDLAPFLIMDQEGLAVFRAHSAICKAADAASLERWLVAATRASFAGMLLWRLRRPEDGGGNWSTPEECGEFLQYEWQPFARLPR
ncbi:MAG: RNA polymerase sigma factor, partial [Planctomycetota bacterium]